MVFLSYPDFKTQIKEIRREAIELGYAISTMDSYERIWNKFIEWKQEEHFVYQEEDYSRFGVRLSREIKEKKMEKVRLKMNKILSFFSELRK